MAGGRAPGDPHGGAALLRAPDGEGIRRDGCTRPRAREGEGRSCSALFRTHADGSPSRPIGRSYNRSMSRKRSSSRAARCAAPRRYRSRAAKRSTAATAGTRRSPSKRSSRASSRSSATSARTARRNISIYHSTLKRPCGQLIVVDDGYDLFLTMMLYPSFALGRAAYHLEGDPEGRLVRRDPRRRRRGRGDRAVGRRQVAPRDLPVRRTPKPEDWNGEM